MRRSCADPIDWEGLGRFAPSPFLVKHFSRLARENRVRRTASADAGSHNLAHFRMMNQVILAAWGLVRRSSQEAGSVLVLGAKECSDVPLRALTEEALVYLVDVDTESLDVARQSLDDPHLRERIVTLQMDASLFETYLIGRIQSLVDRHPRDIGRALRGVLEAHGEAADAGPGAPLSSRLPIREGSVDLAVSSMVLSQFMIGYLRVLLQLFFDAYGKEETKRCLLAGASTRPGLGTGGGMADLLRSCAILGRKAAEVHVRELCRIVRDRGLVVVSDHALHGRCVFVTEETIEVDLHSLVPYSQNPWDQKRIRSRQSPDTPLPSSVRVDRLRGDQAFFVDGVDSLGNIIRGIPGTEILEERRWWWVTERAGGSTGGLPAWHVSLVEAFTLVPGASSPAS